MAKLKIARNHHLSQVSITIPITLVSGPGPKCMNPTCDTPRLENVTHVTQSHTSSRPVVSRLSSKNRRIFHSAQDVELHIRATRPKRFLRDTQKQVRLDIQYINLNSGVCGGSMAGDAKKVWDRDSLPEHLQEPEFWSPEKRFYFGVHASLWRVRFYNTLFWLAGIGTIISLFQLGISTDATWLYTGTFFCWLASCFFRESSLIATCVVGTGLSIWQGGEQASKYWKISIGRVD